MRRAIVEEDLTFSKMDVGVVYTKEQQRVDAHGAHDLAPGAEERGGRTIIKL
jgi:hypothetical protein